MEEPVKPPKRTHLICGKPVLSIAGFLVSAYFAYSAYADLRDGDFFWQNGWWTVLTWAVWLVLTAGLLSETRCWRERLLFGCALAAFTIGLIFSAWTSAQPAVARYAREASLAVWSVAALSSVATLSRPTKT
ncbi:MAG: hypothetical protein DMG93_17675 [Acidobacteria bacterium]|nr:MAG: hypothetical protein DMG93_17675 [Acidobacteriota bacterium]